jgi:squalene-hopene/tetraprenyl-beta-curcumene cyclase
VKAFGSESLKAAAKYLELGAVSWVRERSCVNCHTTGPYMTEYTAWSRQFGQPNEEVHTNFVNAVPKEVQEVKEIDNKGHKHYPGAFFSVWCSVGLAEWDRHINGKLSEATERSLRDMFEHQSEDGAFVSHGEVEIPHITTDFELSLQAARAITAAPEWLAGLKDEALLARVEKLKQWLRTAPPKNDFDRVLKLQLAHYMPDMVPQSDRDAALTLLTSKQHADGGWSTRDMSSVNDWHFEMSAQPHQEPARCRQAGERCVHDCAGHRINATEQRPRVRPSHPTGLDVVEARTARERTLVDALALPR